MTTGLTDKSSGAELPFTTAILARGGSPMLVVSSERPLTAMYQQRSRMVSRTFSDAGPTSIAPPSSVSAPAPAE